MTKKKKRSNLLLIIAIVAVLGFGGAFAYYAHDYYLWWRDGQAARENAAIAQDIFQDQMTTINDLVGTVMLLETHGHHGEGQGVSVTTMATAFSTSPLDEARARTNNSDIVAYLFIEGTNVSNVVLQGPDNAFYLYRDMFGNHNVNGSLFLDHRNSPLFDDPNTIIYGHNMNNGTMFHNLRYYMNRDFFEAHPHITVITDDRVFVYEIFSVFRTGIYFDYIQVDFEEGEFEALLTEITRRRAYDTGITANADDNILILSTCTNVTEDTRIVVAARLMKIVILD